MRPSSSDAALTRGARREYFVKSGFLQKRGQLKTGWKRRWFVLRVGAVQGVRVPVVGGRLTAVGVRAQPPFLFYYRASNDEVEKGVVDLLGATVKLPAASEQIRVSVARGWPGGGTLADGQALQEPFSFEIHALTRVWYLRAANEHDRQSWIEGILEFNELSA